MIGIFNRSHYEEVLVVKVHPQYLGGQRLPDSPDTNKDFWKNRYEQIRHWEAMLAANGTTILKFFLHVSLDEQKQRFLDRINEPEKNWKFSSGDAKERAFWNDYMNAYTEAMQATSTDTAPWHVIPADNKHHRNLMIARLLVKTLKGMKLRVPPADPALTGLVVE